MPRMRCIDNNGYETRLTLGRIYEVAISGNSRMANINDDNGTNIDCFSRRFEAVEVNPVQAEPVAEPTEATQPDRNPFDTLAEMLSASPISSPGYARPVAMPTITPETLRRTFTAPEWTDGLTPVSVIVDEVAPTRQEIVIPEYTQLPGNAQMKMHTRILLPTRNTYSNRDLILKPTEDALETGKDFLYITSTMSSSNRVAIGYTKRQTYGYYNLRDLEVYTTKFVEGAIENGHRIKDNCGKTHTFEDYNQTVPNNQTLLEDNDEYITYIDSTGWYIRRWKQLVTKPRGTVQYTEYKAMCPECYAAYKLQQESRMAYLKALKAKKDEENAARLAEERIERERREAEERARLEREAERRRIAEEEERQFIERNRNGIWKHHKKG